MVGEMFIMNPRHRRRRHARTRRHVRSNPSPRRRRRRYASFRRNPRRSAGIAGASTVRGAGQMVFQAIIPAGAGAASALIVPTFFPMTSTGWGSVIGSGLTAVGGGILVSKMVNPRAGGYFAAGGLGVAGVKLLKQLGVFQAFQTTAGIADFDEGYTNSGKAFGDTGQIAPNMADVAQLEPDVSTTF